MEGDGGDASAPSVAGAETSTPTQEQNGPTTTADMPIAPVYAGSYAPYNFSVVTRSRRQTFMESQATHRHMDYGTDIPNPFVPAMQGPKGGIDMNRNLAGNGIPYEDPLDLFKSQPNTMDRKPEGVKRPNRPTDPSRQRQRGTSEYRKLNKDNVDNGGKK